MSKIQILSTGIVAISLSLTAGCTTTPQQDQNISQAPPARTNPVQATESPSPTASPTRSNQNTLSSSDRRFINEAAQGGLAEVQLGQLASQRGASNAVKEFGQRMVQDHTQVNNQLKQLATQKGITLPTTIGSKNQQIKQRLSKLSGASFDREYISQMIKDHQKDISAFRNQAQNGKNPDLKAFAAQTLPTLEQHLQQARAIANPGSNPGTSTSSPTPTTRP